MISSFGTQLGWTYPARLWASTLRRSEDIFQHRNSFKLSIKLKHRNIIKTTTMSLQILAHFTGVLLRCSKAWICFWFPWINREILTFSFSGPHPLGSHTAKAETSGSMTTSTRATFLCFRKSTPTFFITCLWPLRSPGRNFICTQNQQKWAVSCWFPKNICCYSTLISFALSSVLFLTTSLNACKSPHFLWHTLVLSVPGRRVLFVLHLVPKHNLKTCLPLPLNSSVRWEETKNTVS